MAEGHGQPCAGASVMIDRCPWAGIEDPEYARYHDEEWGVPKTDDQALFEEIILEGFQAGLSWLTILRKRDSFRKAFHGFDAEKIARFDDGDRARLMADAGIVRNRAKVDATIANAKAYLTLTEKQAFSSFIWGLFDGKPQINRFASFADVPAETEESRRLSKALKSQGFRFVGPTTMYAFMQASGIVNDHLVSCPRHAVCSEMQTNLDLESMSRHR